MNLKLHGKAFTQGITALLNYQNKHSFASYLNSAFKSREAIVVCYLENIDMAAEEEYLPKHKLPQCVNIFI